MIKNWRILAFALMPCISDIHAGPWISSTLPGIGKVVVLESNGETMFAGTETGSIYRSQNAGLSWQKTWIEIPPATPPSPGFDESAPISDFLIGDSVVLAAAGHIMDLGMWDCWSMNCGNPTLAGGILRSTDDGLTWREVGPTAVTTLAYLPGNDSGIIAATLTGIHLSRDKGVTWAETTLVTAGGAHLIMPGQSAIRQMQTMGRYVYFLWSDDLYRLESARNGLQVSLVLPEVDCFTPWGERLLVSAGGATLLGNPIHPWDTLAVIYANIPPLLSITTWGKYLVGVRSQFGSTNQPTMVVFSEDSGRIWQETGSQGHNPHQVMTHDGTLFSADRFEAVKRWDSNSQSWASASEGIFEVTVTKIAAANGAVLVASTINSQTWLHGKGPEPSDSWQALPWKTPYITSRSGVLHVSDSSLWTSTKGIAPLTWTPTRSAYGNLILGDTWHLIVRSDHSRELCADETCETLPRGRLPAPYWNSNFIEVNGYRDAAVRGDTVYLLLDSLYRSANRGKSFELIGSTPLHFTHILFSNGVLYAIGNSLWTTDSAWNGSSSMAQSSDGGKTWTKVNTIGIQDAQRVKSISERNGELFVITDYGVFWRELGMTTWKDLGKGRPNSRLLNLDVDGEWLVAGDDRGQVHALHIGPEPVAASLDKPIPRIQRDISKHPGFLGFAKSNGLRHTLDGRVIQMPTRNLLRKSRKL